jgi:hypothetical protein
MKAVASGCGGRDATNVFALRAGGLVEGSEHFRERDQIARGNRQLSFPRQFGKGNGYLTVSGGHEIHAVRRVVWLRLRCHLAVERHGELFLPHP